MPTFHVLLVVLLALVVNARPPQVLPAINSLVHVEGVVYVRDQIVATRPEAITFGTTATVRTEAGRAAVSLRGGGTLLLAEHSSARVDILYNFSEIDVFTGSAIVISTDSSPKVNCASATRLSSVGIFRFDVQPADSQGKVHRRFRVYEGAAAAPLSSLLAALRPGQGETLPGSDVYPMIGFSPMELDDFDRWSRRHAVKSERF